MKKKLSKGKRPIIIAITLSCLLLGGMIAMAYTGSYGSCTKVGNGVSPETGKTVAAYIDVSVTTNNATTYAFTVKGGVTSKATGYTSISGVDLTYKISGAKSGNSSKDNWTYSNSDSTNKKKWNDWSYSVAKTHAQQSVTITVTAKGNGSNSFAKSTATYSFNIPAKTTYTITYNANGGTGAPGNGTKWHDEAYTVSTTRPTRSGYTFVNWKITATGVTVAPGGTISAGSNAAYTLQAQWQANTYNITYNLDGGVNASANPATYKVTDAGISLQQPKKGNYTFIGWTGSNGTTPQTSVTIATGSTGDKTYTANWTPNNFATHVMFVVGKSGDAAPAVKSTTENTGTTQGELGNIKGEGWQYDVFSGNTPASLRRGYKYHTRSLTYKSDTTPGYHYIKPDGTTNY